MSRVDLQAQSANVHLDHIRERIVTLIPHVLGDVFACYQLARATREVFEQGIFFGCKLDGPPGPPYVAAANVDTQISHENILLVRARPTPQ